MPNHNNKLKITDISVTVVAGALSLLGMLTSLAPLAVLGIEIQSIYEIFKSSGIFDEKTSIINIEAVLQNTYECLIKKDRTGRYEPVLNAIVLNIKKKLDAGIISKEPTMDEFLETIDCILNKEDDIQSLENKRIILEFEEAFFNQLTNGKDDNALMININFIKTRLSLVEDEITDTKNTLLAQIKENRKRIEEIEKLQKIQTRKAPPLVPFENLYGRKKDISTIAQHLYSYKHMVFLYGMGGVGKTELCASVCSKSNVERSKIFWFKCTQSLDDGILVIADTIDDEEEKRKNRIKRAKEFLYALDTSYLVVFDNLEELKKEDVEFLGRLTCKVIVTSRVKHKILSHMSVSQEVNIINDINSCIEIFKHYCDEKEILDNELDDLKNIISLAGNHTLAIELIAGIYSVSGTIHSVKELLKTIEQSGFNLKIETNTNHDPEKRDFTKHMKYLFDISGIKKNKDKIYILKNICILPSLPIKFLDIIKWLDKYYENTIINLAQSSWIKRRQYRTDNKPVDTVEMHQIICDTLQKSLEPEYADCKTLINALAKEINKQIDDPKRYKAEYMPFCIGIAEYFGVIPEGSIVYLYSIMADIYKDIAEYPKALLYYGKSLLINEKVLGIYSPITATSYQDIADVYQHEGEYQKALNFYNLALKVFKKVLWSYHPKIAILYNSIGNTHLYKGDYHTALAYFNKAKIQQKMVLDAYHPDIAVSYNNIGGIYKNLGDYQQALDYYTMAIKINEKALGKDHPDMAASYNNIALVFQSKGDYNKALIYYNKALETLKNILGDEHPSIATSYNNIAGIYKSLGDYEKALEYFNLSIKINEKILGKDHPDMAGTYNNIASFYHDMGNYQKALDYYTIAIKIMKKNFGFYHPNIANSYNNIAMSYETLGDYSKALDCYISAIKIYLKVLGEHPNTANSYNNIALLYHDMGDYQKALEYSIKSFYIMRNSLGEDHPKTKSFFNNMVICYKKSGKDTSKFEEWLNENLTKLKSEN